MSDILMDLLKPRIEQEKREYAEKRDAEVDAFWKEKEVGWQKKEAFWQKKEASWLEEKEELLRKLAEAQKSGGAVTA